MTAAVEAVYGVWRGMGRPSGKGWKGGGGAVQRKFSAPSSRPNTAEINTKPSNKKANIYTNTENVSISSVIYTCTVYGGNPCFVLPAARRIVGEETRRLHTTAVGIEKRCFSLAWSPTCCVNCCCWIDTYCICRATRDIIQQILEGDMAK